jgi:DNA polymerase-3 subunit alpha
VRIALERHGARCEIQLGERALFYPSDAALASWTAQAHQQKAEIVFD